MFAAPGIPGIFGRHIPVVLVFDGEAESEGFIHSSCATATTHHFKGKYRENSRFYGVDFILRETIFCISGKG